MQKGNLTLYPNAIIWWEALNHATRGKINCPCVVLELEKLGFWLITLDTLSKSWVSYQSECFLDDMFHPTIEKVQRYLDENLERLESQCSRVKEPELKTGIIQRIKMGLITDSNEDGEAPKKIKKKTTGLLLLDTKELDSEPATA